MVARTSVLMLAMAGAMLRAEQCASFVIPSTGFTGLLRASRPASGQNSGRGSSLLGVIMKYEIDYKLDKKRDVEGGSVYDVTVNVDPKLVKDSYGAIMKDFKKVAQFPGFRKGTIPPFMLPKCKEFAILRCLEKTLTQVADEEKLKCASPERKPVLDDEQTRALVSTFKETQGFTYVIEAELAPNPDGDDAGLGDLLVRE